MIRVSIIIPVYNTEKYLTDCLNSFTMQLVPEVELILVDDGSTDNSADICRLYERKYPNIRYFQQPRNLGVSAARNRGIKESVGKFVLFADSDDFVADGYIQKILQYCDSGFDLVSFGHFDYVHNGDEIYTAKKSGMNCACTAHKPNLDSWNKLLLKSFFASPWNKLFLKSFFASSRNKLSDDTEQLLQFDTSCVCFEDYLFNLDYCRRIESFQIVPEPLYYYRQDSTKVSGDKRKWGERFAVSNQVAKRTDKFIDEKKDFDLSFLRRYVYTAFMTELQFVYNNKYREFDQAIFEMSETEAFRKSLNAFKPAGKSIIMLKWALDLNMHKVQKILLTKKLVDWH